MNPGLTRPLKVDDAVWSKRFGYGTVINVTQGVNYPYLVRFNASTSESFSVLGAYQISNPNIDFDLTGPLQKDETIELNKLNESIKITQTITVKNKENGDKEGTIIDIDGCKIFRSGYSMIILPQNDDLWLKLQFSF